MKSESMHEKVEREIDSALSTTSAINTSHLISEWEFYHVILSLNSLSAAGHDEISVAMVKYCLPLIKTQLRLVVLVLYYFRANFHFKNCVYVFQMVFKKFVVKECGRNNVIFRETSFFSFPTVKENEIELLKKRRSIWIHLENHVYSTI